MCSVKENIHCRSLNTSINLIKPKCTFVYEISLLKHVDMKGVLKAIINARVRKTINVLYLRK